jgi:hypothetical protein
MADIYKNASGVLAWLGVESDDNPVDIQAICNLSRGAEDIGLGRTLDNQDEIFLTWIRAEASRFTETLNFTGTAKRANFSRFYSSSWFTRMWIVQEALLASRLTLFCGTKSLAWADFEKAMVLLYTMRETIHMSMLDSDSFIKHAWNLVVVRDYYKRFAESGGDQRLKFNYFANQLRRRDCKDDDLVIESTYDKSVLEVFTDFAKQQLSQGNLDILYQAGLCRSLASTFSGIQSYSFPKPDPLPSWVSDYRKNVTYVGWTPYFGDELSFLQDNSVAPGLHRQPSKNHDQCGICGRCRDCYSPSFCS